MLYGKGYHHIDTTPGMHVGEVALHNSHLPYFVAGEHNYAREDAFNNLSSSYTAPQVHRLVYLVSSEGDVGFLETSYTFCTFKMPLIVNIGSFYHKMSQINDGFSYKV